jgi:hypothetical protein
LTSTSASGTFPGAAVSEADRHQLYTGLVELLGESRASTLMAYLPTYDPSEVAQRLTAIETRLAVVESGITGLRSDTTALATEMHTRFTQVMLTVIAGFFVVVAGLVGVLLAGLP